MTNGCEETFLKKENISFCGLAVETSCQMTRSKKTALNFLSQFAYEKWFEKAYWRITEYSTKTIYEEDSDGHRVIAGNQVSHNNNDSDSNSLFIPKNGRCPKPWCVCHDIQCVHEFDVDKCFILNKWSTRWWSDSTYKSNYGIYGNEFIGKRDEPHTMGIHVKTLCQTEVLHHKQVKNRIFQTVQ